MRSKKNIYYQLDGQEDAPVILFSNSLGTDYSMWDSQVEKLKDQYRILRYDNCRDLSRSIEDLGTDVIELLDELKLCKVHFCGISLGGLIGLWLAANESERFFSLALANTSPRISTPEVWEKRIELVKTSGLRPVAEASPSRWFTQDFIDGHQQIIEQSTKAFARTSADSYVSCCEVLKTTDLWNGLTQISVPVLIIGGEYDQVTTVDEARAMGKLIKSATVSILPGSHLSNIECSQQFTDELSKFVANHTN